MNLSRRDFIHALALVASPGVPIARRAGPLTIVVDDPTWRPQGAVEPPGIVPNEPRVVTANEYEVPGDEPVILVVGQDGPSSGVLTRSRRVDLTVTVPTARAERLIPSGRDAAAPEVKAFVGAEAVTGLLAAFRAPGAHEWIEGLGPGAAGIVATGRAARSAGDAAVEMAIERALGGILVDVDVLGCASHVRVMVAAARALTTREAVMAVGRNLGLGSHAQIDIRTMEDEAGGDEVQVVVVVVAAVTAPRKGGA